MSKIEDKKLFEYAYGELAEEEIAEIEEKIAQDPEALKIVNEYLFLKQNLKNVPIEVETIIKEKINEKTNLLDQLVGTAKKYITLDLKPVLVFSSVIFIAIGVSVFQFNQNPLLNKFEISQIEQSFTAYKKGDVSKPWEDFKILQEIHEAPTVVAETYKKLSNQKNRLENSKLLKDDVTKKQLDQNNKMVLNKTTLMRKENCEEHVYKELILKLCFRKNKYVIDKQTIIPKK